VGPIALFDKSFIQSLSVDESVWFDRFFLPVVCPVFFIETLADLAKTPRDGRTAEAEVRIIASKFPEMHGSPCVEYSEMSLANLMGHEIPMDGRVPRPGGRAVSGGGRTGTVYDQSPEDAAFQRWQHEEFAEVERLFAAKWREALNAVNLEEIASTFRSLGINPQSCRSLPEAYQLAAQIVSGHQKTLEQVGRAVRLLRIPQLYHHPISERWQRTGRPPLSEFAPYTAFVVTVEVFFQIALAAKLISTEKNSNRTDIAYLFYIPFCGVFVSSDRLHRRVASLLLRSDQEFIWGQDLKADLGKINAHFARLPGAEKEGGVMLFANYPPTDEASLVADVWKRLGFRSRSHHENLVTKMGPEMQKRLADQVTAFNEGKTIAPHAMGPEGGDTMSIERRIRGKKGSWWQIPRDLTDPDDK
jgi:hypothetical protein